MAEWLEPLVFGICGGVGALVGRRLLTRRRPEHALEGLRLQYRAEDGSVRTVGPAPEDEK